MKTHLLNMVLYAAVISALFSLFMREGGRMRVRFALSMTGILVGAAIVVGWLMALID